MADNEGEATLVLCLRQQTGVDENLAPREHLQAMLAAVGSRTLGSISQQVRWALRGRAVLTNAFRMGESMTLTCRHNVHGRNEVMPQHVTQLRVVALSGPMAVPVHLTPGAARGGYTSQEKDRPGRWRLSAAWITLAATCMIDHRAAVSVLPGAVGHASVKLGPVLSS